VISIIIPTYNPNIVRLSRTIQSIIDQSFPVSDWELIIVDNNSTTPVETLMIDTKVINLKIVEESKQGLTFARLKGVEQAVGKYIIFVDDDNILNADYLKNVNQIFLQNPHIGAIGGNIFPEFEVEPAIWTKNFWSILALRDLGSRIQISTFQRKDGLISHYPTFAPIGAGMAVRRKSLNRYIETIQSHSEKITDRKGNKLTSSGDNEIVMQVLFNNDEVAFFPQLSLVHLIPENRLTKDYLGRLNEGIMESWTTFLLKYHICPWPKIKKWTVPLRKLKSYFSLHAWSGNVAYVKWKGSCGIFMGLAK